MYYHSPLSLNNGSSFILCNFKTNSLLINGTYPDSRVSLYEVDGVSFKGCSFEYNAGTAYAAGSRGKGISSTDATWYVDKNGTTKSQFTNFDWGIDVENGNALKWVNVMNTNFYDVVSYGAYFNTINTPVFTDNYVRTAGTGSGTGLYLQTCKYYNVKNNTFLQNSGGSAQSDVGIYVYNSQAGAHKIYRNSFSGLNIGIGAIDNNSGSTNTTDGLKMNCNDFTPSANMFDVALMGNSPTVMKTQGAVTSQNSGNLVRNKYAAASTCTNCENRWYIGGTSVKVVDHGTNSDAATKPTPQPANSDYSVNVVASGIALNYALHCPAVEGGGGGGRLAGINANLSSLQPNEMASAKGVNPSSNKPSFEIQAAYAEKLNYFLTDTLPASKDSVIALLQNNATGMEDADVQLTYAYINKGDFAKAQQNATSLNSTKPEWAALQQKLIAFHLSAKKAFDLKTNSEAKTLLENYAGTEDKNGRGAAQAILKFATGLDYFIPHPVPFIEAGTNKSINNPLLDELNLSNSDFNLYPNPAINVLNLVYKGKDDKTVNYTLANSLGHVLYEGKIKQGTKTEISLDNFASGVYLLTAYREKTKIYQAKVVCIK